MPPLRPLALALLTASLGCSSTSSGGADSGSPEDGASGSSSGGGSGDAACATGSMTFVLDNDPTSTTSFCLGGTGTCSAQWLDIRSGTGSSLAIDMPCETTCAACQPVACDNLCAVPSPLGDAGVQTTWDGTFFTSGTCGAGVACVSGSCAAAGVYTARACGYAESPDAGALVGCQGSSTPTCVEAPFQWPPPAGTPPLHLVLGGQSDRG